MMVENLSKGSIVIPMLWMKKLRLREVISLIPRHTAGKEQSSI